MLFILVLGFFTNNLVFGSTPPKKVMFLVHTEMVGGKGVYEIYREMKKSGIDVKIVATPSFYETQLLADVDLTFTEKFSPEDVLYPCGKKSPYKNCESIATYQPDYIFVQNPYNSFEKSILDPNFLNASLKKIAKIMYIVYGPHLFHQDTINDPNLPKLVDTVFVDSESTKDIYVKKYAFPKDRVVVSGYQSYQEVRNKLKEKRNGNNAETILWLPRWLLSFRGRDLYEGGSTFLSYYHFFYQFAKENSQINFIIRPHILLHSYAVKSGFLTQEALDEIFAKFESLKNVTLSLHKDRSLVDDILAADIVISDGTSALGEVIVADKPVIYLSNGWNNEFNSNPLSKELKENIYFAYDPQDILGFLDHIRETNYYPYVEYYGRGKRGKIMNLKHNVLGAIWPQSTQRDNFKKRLDPVENPARSITEYILRN